VPGRHIYFNTQI